MCTVPDQSGGPQRSIEASAAMLMESAPWEASARIRATNTVSFRTVAARQATRSCLAATLSSHRAPEAVAGLLAEAERGLGALEMLSGAALSAAGGVSALACAGRGPDGHDARRQNGGERDAAPGAQYFALGRITTWEPSISQWAWSSA